MSSREILVRLRAEVGNFRTSMASAATSATAVGTATAGAGRTIVGAMTQAQAAAASTRKELYDIGKAAQDSAKGFGLSYNAAGQLTDEFGAMVTAAHAAELGLDTASDATREFAAQSAHAAGEAAAATEASRTGMDALMAQAAANEEAWDKVGKGLLVIGTAITAAVGVSIAKFAEFDKAMSSVDAATHETVGNMELLRQKAIEVGADTSFSASEAAQGIEELAKAGLSTKDILNGGLAGAMSLAAAGALGVAEASEFAASAMVQFGLEGADIPHIADLLAAGAGKAQGSVNDMGLALSYAGVPAKGLGVSIEETTGSIALFASNGIIGEKAGTALRSMFVSMANPVGKTKKLMDELGISFFDANDDFIGMEKVAGVLQDRMGDLGVGTRNAALAQIFGSEALGAAQALYAGGSGKVKEWTDAVNDSGYAADTAARMQNNLAGDVEKLGGAFDTLMTKSGTGPAEMLRGMVQGAESAVDAVGKVPTPVLTAVTVATALVGGLALLGGAFITIVPKVAATRLAMSQFAAGSPGVVAGMRKMGKAGGIAAVGIAAVGIAMATIPNDRKKLDLDVMASDMIKLGKSGTSVKDAFSPGMFDAINDAPMQGKKIESLGDALKKVTDISTNDEITAGMTAITSGIKGMFGAGETTTQFKETQKAVQGMSDALGSMVESGDAEAAGIAFAKIAKEGEKSGVAVIDTAKAFSTYETALRKQADTLKVSLTDAEYQQWMLGNVPPLIDAAAASAEGQTAAAEAMAAANEETAAALAEVGLKADGTVQSLGKLLEAMFATGLAQLSANEASIQWQESLEDLDASIAKYGTSLDITTEAGKANQRALDGMASAGIANMTAMANNGATQEDLQGKMRGTYDSLIAAAGQFGITGNDADTMARKVLGIPDDANVNTAIQNYVDSMAKLNGIQTEAEQLNGKTANVYINTVRTTLFEQKGVPYRDDVNTDGTWNPMGGYTGGVVGQLIAGRAGGGMVPGRIPLNSQGDNILAAVNGKPFGLRSGEMVINEDQTRKNLPLLKSINDGTYQAPSKSLAGSMSGSYSRAAFSGSSSGGGGGGTTFDFSGATFTALDPASLRRDIAADIEYKLNNRNGVRLV